jgi:Mg-chelatase subunit ChlD
MKRIIYEVGRWPCFLHREARGLDMATSKDPPILRLEDELFEKLYAGGAELLPERGQDGKWAAWAHAIHDACDKLPAFNRLADETRGDADAAALGVEELMKELRAIIDEQNAKLPPEESIRKVLRMGAEAASVALEDYLDAVGGLGQVMFGGGKGSHERRALDDKKVGLARRLRGDPRLKRIAQLAGRFTRIAQQKRRSKVRHGAEEISDVELGNDLGRLLPVELVKLRHPRLHALALRDLLERKAMQYALTGKERLGKGPLVLLLDRSGSMDGDKDTWSTAVALALLGMAHDERRTFAIVAFTDQVIYDAVVKPGERLDEEALNLTCNGGTDIDAAVARGLDIVERNPGALHEADLVLVTDGCSLAERAAELKNKAKALGVSVLGVGIGVAPDLLAPWADTVEVITSLDGLGDQVADALFTRAG